VHRFSDAELTDHLREIERAVRMLESVRAKTVAEVEARRAFAADGFLSATSWLVHMNGCRRGGGCPTGAARPRAP
jgi:hypothetical protein